MLYEGKQWFEPAQGVPASVHVKTASVSCVVPNQKETIKDKPPTINFSIWSEPWLATLKMYWVTFLRSTISLPPSGASQLSCLESKQMSESGTQRQDSPSPLKDS